MLLSHTLYQHITKYLYTSVPSILHMMSNFQQKTTRHAERQKAQFEETEQTGLNYSKDIRTDQSRNLK